MSNRRRMVNRNRRPARSMLRTASLVVISLAAVGGFFVVYRLAVPPVGEAPATPSPMPSIHSAFLAEQAPAGGMTIDGVGVQASERSGVTILDKETLHKRLHMSFHHPRQVDSAGRQFHVQQPIITYYMDKGQQAVIRSDTALLTSGRVDEIDLQKGRFQGNVRVDIDRRTAAWRQDNPELSARPPAQDQQVRLWMDDMKFDRELGRLEVPGHVRIESREMTLTGSGLAVQWSQDSGRIETLNLQQGDELVFTNTAATGFELSSGWAASEEPRPAAPAPAETTAPPAVGAPPAPAAPAEAAAPEILDEDTIVIDLVPERPEGPKFLTYRIEFDRTVEARQEGSQQGRILADHLGVLLDLNPGQEALPPAEPVAPPAEAAAEGAPSEPPPPAPQPARVVVTWSGALEIQAVDDLRAEAQPARQHLEATGAPVVVMDRSGSARGARLEYHRETGFTRFDGAEGVPIAVDVGPEFKLLASTQVTLDREARRALCRGDVHVVMDELQLRGQTVDAWFRTPTDTQRSPRQLLERLECDQDVGLRTRSDALTCRHLTVHFAPDAAGRNIPKRALAVDDIDMVQRDRRLTARRTVDAEFGELPTDDQGRVTGDAPMIRRLRADGEVQIIDLLQNWDIAGERLDCTFDEWQAITYGYIEGPAGRQARVKMGLYEIEGQAVTFDDARSWAHVPGPGRVRFAINEDLDGRRTREPVPIEVRWQREMRLRGQDDLLVFDGDVVANSRNNLLRGDVMRIRLADAAPPPAAPRDPGGMWFLRPYAPEVARLNRLWGDGESRRAGLGKRATHILAEGSAGFDSRSDSEDGRLRSRSELWGPRIAIDLLSKMLLVEGAGQLLIQDYPDPQRVAVAQQQPTPAGLLGDVRADGPSQTSVGWDTFMRYDYRQRVAEFESNADPVAFLHRSGQYVRLTDRLRQDTGISEADVELLRAHDLGRRADLSARRLLVEFLQGRSGGSRGAGEMSTGQLRQFQASGDVVLVDQRWYVTGQRLDYVQDSQLIAVFGGPGNDAYISETDPRTGEIRQAGCPELRIELRTNRVEAPCRIQATGR